VIAVALGGIAILILVSPLLVFAVRDVSRARQLEFYLHHGADRRHGYRRTPERPWPEPDDIDR
jgi:hypothetical protein